MVDLIIGVPGSGKTYFTVDKVYKLITSEHKKYKHIYTNINGFNYQKANEIAQTPDYVKPFEFEELNVHIEKEFEFFTAQKERKKNPIIPLKNDEKSPHDKDDVVNFDYDETCKASGIYEPFLDSLIIIDECHLYFEDKTDEPKIRFLSYHRHFNIDIILVTQGKNLIHKKYLSFVETMYKALSGSKRFFSTRFRYRKYASYQEYSQNMIETTSLSLNPKVSELYNSGSNVASQTVLTKILMPVFVLMILSFLFYKFFVAERYNPKSSQPTSVETSAPETKDTHKPDVINTDDTDTEKRPFFSVRCFNKACNFSNIDYSFDEHTMYKFINAFNCKVIIPDNSEPLFTMYILRCDKDLQKVLSLYSKNQSSSKAVYNEETSSHSLISK